MEHAIDLNCDKHSDIYLCPDVLASYSPRFDEYGLIVHDGGSSIITIMYCPWCGQCLPESKCDAWFDALDKLGFDNPFDQEIPVKFNSDAWYRKS